MNFSGLLALIQDDIDGHTSFMSIPQSLGYRGRGDRIGLDEDLLIGLSEDLIDDIGSASGWTKIYQDRAFLAEGDVGSVSA
jgi:hypothetical protein